MYLVFFLPEKNQAQRFNISHLLQLFHGYKVQLEKEHKTLSIKMESNYFDR